MGGALLLVASVAPSSAFAQPPEADEPVADEAGVPARDAAEDAVPAAEAPEPPAAPAEAPPADDPNIVQARERIARANQLYEEENYDAAVAEFHEILELLGEHPVRFQVLYNIAKSYEGLFRYDKAMEFYGRFLEEGGAETELAPEVNAKIQLLEGLLGTILIRANVPGYEVWVDDRLVGNDLERVLVPGGSHVVEVRASGYVPNQREVQVPARAERSVEFELEELAEEYEGLPSYLFWAAGGAAVAAALGGAAYGIKAILRRNQIDDLKRDDPHGAVGLVSEADQEDVARLARNADIFFGAALLLGTSALVFAFFTEWDDDGEVDAEDEPSASFRLSPAVSRESAGIWIEGTF